MTVRERERMGDRREVKLNEAKRSGAERKRCG